MADDVPSLTGRPARHGDDGVVRSDAGVAATPFGRRGFILGAAGTAGAIAGASLFAGRVAAADPEYSAFRVVDPTRLVDTRPEEGDFGSTRLSDTVRRVQVTGRQLNGSSDVVPAEATAAVFTLVGLNRVAGPNYLSAYPTGTAWPGTANLNMAGYGNVSANLVTVKIGTGGAVDVLSLAAAEVVLDLVGVYVPTGGDAVSEGRYRLLPVPQRAVDTRTGGRAAAAGETVRVDLTSLEEQGFITADAVAVSANITAVQANRGFIAAYPFGTQNPGTSTLNVAQDDTRGIGTMVKLGTENGRIGFNVFVEAGAHVVVDVAGYMTGPGDNPSTTGLFVPVEPERILDTRLGVGGLKRLWPGWTRAFQVPAAFRSKANAVVMNLAATRTMGRGYFTLLGAQTDRALVSNLNVTGPGQTISNHAITATSTLGVEVYSSSGGDVVCDVVGWFTASSQGPAQPDLAFPPANPDPPATPTPYWMDIPRIGLGRSVVDGDSTAVVDSGRVWHWTGTGLVGQGQAIAAFAHRTDSGGPFRNVHVVGPGDQVALFTGDQRKYTYEYVDRVVTSADPSEILASTRFRGGEETLAVIACTVGFDSSKSAYPDPWAPTSVRYRIVVRFRLVRWEDVAPTG